MDLEQRLARLERANRRMKRIGTLVVVVAAAVVLSGAADGKDLPDLVVRSLTLKDKDGKTRARLAMVYESPHLDLFDKDGKRRVMLSAIHDRADLVFFAKDGKSRVSLGLFDKGRRILDVVVVLQNLPDVVVAQGT